MSLWRIIGDSLAGASGGSISFFALRWWFMRSSAAAQVRESEAILDDHSIKVGDIVRVKTSGSMYYRMVVLRFKRDLAICGSGTELQYRCKVPVIALVKQ